jgi:hypothetical protein
MKLPLLAVLTCLAALPAAAQMRGDALHLQLHPINPSMSLSPSTDNNPLAGQEREDYATSLMNAQRELLQQNPTGLGREEQAIERQLNTYTGPR